MRAILSFFFFFFFIYAVFSVYSVCVYLLITRVVGCAMQVYREHELRSNLTGSPTCDTLATDRLHFMFATRGGPFFFLLLRQRLVIYTPPRFVARFVYNNNYNSLRKLMSDIYLCVLFFIFAIDLWYAMKHSPCIGWTVRSRCFFFARYYTRYVHGEKLEIAVFRVWHTVSRLPIWVYDFSNYPRSIAFDEESLINAILSRVYMYTHRFLYAGFSVKKIMRLSLLAANIYI